MQGEEGIFLNILYSKYFHFILKISQQYPQYWICSCIFLHDAFTKETKLNWDPKKQLYLKGNWAFSVAKLLLFSIWPVTGCVTVEKVQDVLFFLLSVLLIQSSMFEESQSWWVILSGNRDQLGPKASLLGPDGAARRSLKGRWSQSVCGPAGFTFNWKATANILLSDVDLSWFGYKRLAKVSGIHFGFLVITRTLWWAEREAEHRWGELNMRT